MRRAHPAGDRPANEEIHILVGKPGDLAVVQRHIDQLASPCLLARMQRRKYRRCRIHARHDVRNCHADLLRPPPSASAGPVILISPPDAWIIASYPGSMRDCPSARTRKSNRRSGADSPPSARRIKSVARQRSDLEVLEQDIAFAASSRITCCRCRRDIDSDERLFRLVHRK